MVFRMSRGYIYESFNEYAKKWNLFTFNDTKNSFVTDHLKRSTVKKM